MQILLSGSHGTGKSTFLHILKNHLPGFEVFDSVSEKFFKREDFNDLDKMVTLQREFWEYQLEVFTKNKVLSSRSYGDIFAYTSHLFKKSQNSEFLRINQHIISSAKKAKESGNLLVVYFPIHFEIEGKELRSTNKNFQREIDELITGFYRDLQITPYTVIDSTPEERVKDFLSHLKNLGV